MERMTKKRMYHCLFEQSGTFKREIEKLGGAARDYDCCNDYGETDVVCDLFDCIDRAYLGITDRVFSRIKKEDFVFAFFPCTRFEDQAKMIMQGNQYQQVNYSLEKKVNTDLYYHRQLHDMYERVSKLFLIASREGFPLVVENPYSPQHYLTNYFAIKPSIIDKNRRLNGDYYKKPTQYFFVNCSPKNNLLMEPVEPVEERDVSNYAKMDSMNDHRTRKRSEIHPQYASRFLKQYIAEMDENGKFYL